MADSAWAYSHVIVGEAAPPVFGDSDWAYSHVVMADGPGLANSDWAYSHVSINEEIPPSAGDSAWAFSHVTLASPQSPVLVWNGTSYSLVSTYRWYSGSYVLIDPPA